MGASALAGGYASYSAGEAQKKAARYNEDVANQTGIAIGAQTAEEMQVHRRKVAMLLGSIEAAEGANNVSLSFGSPLEVMEAQASAAARDASMIRYSGGIKMMQALSQGASYGMQGVNAADAGTWGGVNSILGGASNMASYGVSRNLKTNGRNGPGYGGY
jgi:hypothetical protein